MNVSLRDASVDDRPQVERLLAAYLFEFDGRTDPYPHLDACRAGTERLPFLIDVDDCPAGVCLIRVRGEGWSIAEFSVEPPYRRTGVGRSAVEALAQRAREAGASYVEAKIRPDNGKALLFWSAIGFEQVAAKPVVTTHPPIESEPQPTPAQLHHQAAPQPPGPRQQRVTTCIPLCPFQPAAASRVRRTWMALRRCPLWEGLHVARAGASSV